MLFISRSRLSLNLIILRNSSGQRIAGGGMNHHPVCIHIQVNTMYIDAYIPPINTLPSNPCTIIREGYISTDYVASRPASLSNLSQIPPKVYFVYFCLLCIRDSKSRLHAQNIQEAEAYAPEHTVYIFIGSIPQATLYHGRNSMEQPWIEGDNFVSSRLNRIRSMLLYAGAHS